MSLDHLWAAWRSAYVAEVSSEPPPPALDAARDGEGGPGRREEAECVFCCIFASGEGDEVHHVIWQGRLSVVLLNAFPYSSGHVLVMPRRHVAELEDLEPEESTDVWEAVRRSVRAIQKAYSPDGCNIGANLGRAAGAGIPRHFHLHVLPRWVGDTNFMTTVASTRVLPEALPDSWSKLRGAWPG